MGGNGTFAAGYIVKYRWETVATIDGVKVLEPMSGGHKLPEEAHSSRMYILQHPQNGNFAQLRIYDKWHRLRFEVGYHREPGARRLLHHQADRARGDGGVHPHSAHRRQDVLGIGERTGVGIAA